MPSFVHDNKMQGKGVKMGGRLKSPRTIQRNLGYPELPGPGQYNLRGEVRIAGMRNKYGHKRARNAAKRRRARKSATKAAQPGAQVEQQAGGESPAATSGSIDQILVDDGTEQVGAPTPDGGSVQEAS